MADWFDAIDEERRAQIEGQPLFFVATAPSDPGAGFANLSPKGRSPLRVLTPKLIGYLDYPGSGNETARHTDENGRITLMVCSFGKRPGIVRLYGQGRAVAVDDAEFLRHLEAFRAELHPYVRQAFLIDIEKLQTSCGYAVPRMDYVGERDTLDRWCEQKLEPRDMVEGVPQPGELRERVS